MQPSARSGDSEPSAVRVSDEKVIVIEVPRFGVEAPPIEQRVRVMSRAALEEEQRAQMAPRNALRALLEEDAEWNARFLREHPESRDVRVQAARLLARLSKRL